MIVVMPVGRAGQAMRRDALQYAFLMKGAAAIQQQRNLGLARWQSPEYGRRRFKVLVDER
jgi:hypothetical protein